ncbi:MAG: DUF58 domain-containing protein [Planctomycetes bacterium]|nr:DUF58 domain-containing protein [Planctomycetota bacterium]
MRRTSAVLGLRITANGVLTACVAMLVGASAFTSDANLLLLIFGVVLGLLAFSAGGCARMVRKVDVERTVAEAVVAGRPFRIIYTLRNRRRWVSAWTLRVTEIPAGRSGPTFPHAFIPLLPPRQDLVVELTASCPSRGRVGLRGIRLSCGFPFGLFTCTVDLQLPGELIVYPAVGRMRRDLWRKHAAAAVAPTRHADRAGGEDEFHGVREYRLGDNPRWIHWRRSAHAGELIVREHVAVRDSQIVFFLDPWPLATEAPPDARRRGGGPAQRSSSNGEDHKAERIISAAATAICDALDAGHRVGLVCRAAVPIIIAPAGGRTHRRRLHHELALLAPGTFTGLDQLIAGIRWSSGWHARCMLFTTQAGELHNRVLRLLATHSDSVMMISPQSTLLDKLFEPVPPSGEPRRTP